MPIEAHLHHDPLVSLILVFGVNLALPLGLALGFAIAGRRRIGDERGAYFGLARWAVLACLVVQVPSVGYLARLFVGTSETGTVTQRALFPNAKQPHCDLTVRTAHGSVEAAVAHGSCLDLAVGSRVPMVTVTSSTLFAQIGQRATVHVGATLLGMLALALLIVAGMVVRSVSRAAPS